jgi:hypothetical protein
MKATELRIGNYVDRNGLMVIRTIKTKQVSFYDTINKNNTHYFNLDEHTKPIPLTEEWLLKLGFEKRNKLSHNWHLCDVPYFAPHIRFEKKIFTAFKWSSSEACALQSIQYVHQLQNFYFALTTQELIITL